MENRKNSNQELDVEFDTDHKFRMRRCVMVYQCQLTFYCNDDIKRLHHRKENKTENRNASEMRRIMHKKP